MNMMEKESEFLDLKWINNGFYKMDDQMKIRVELVKRKKNKGSKQPIKCCQRLIQFNGSTPLVNVPLNQWQAVPAKPRTN